MTITSVDLAPQTISKAYYPNSIIGYNVNGELFSFVPEGNSMYVEGKGQKRLVAEGTTSENGLVVKEFHPEAVEDILGVFGIPALPWGDEAILHIHRGKGDFPQSLVDIPHPILERILKGERQIIANWLKESSPVFWGLNNSYGNLLDGGPDHEHPARGLATAKYPHEQIWRYKRDLGLTPERIREARQNMAWDKFEEEGLSENLGDWVIWCLQDRIHRDYGKSVELQSDHMGFTALFNDQIPQLDTEFINNFWRPVFHTVHAKLREWQKIAYTGDLDEEIDFSRRAHPTGTFDHSEYWNYFRKNPEVRNNQEAKSLYFMRDNQWLRNHIGWAGAMGYFMDKTESSRIAKPRLLATVTVGTWNFGLGPVEGMAIGLTRDQTPVKRTEMAKQEVLYQRTVHAAVL